MHTQAPHKIQAGCKATLTQQVYHAHLHFITGGKMQMKLRNDIIATRGQWGWMLKASVVGLHVVNS